MQRAQGRQGAGQRDDAKRRHGALPLGAQHDGDDLGRAHGEHQARRQHCERQHLDAGPMHGPQARGPVLAPRHDRQQDVRQHRTETHRHDAERASTREEPERRRAEHVCDHDVEPLVWRGS